MKDQGTRHPLEYGIAFQDNQVLTYGSNYHQVFASRQVGSLHLPSGGLVARDPHITQAGLLFDERFLPGRYPVFVTHSFFDSWHEVAFAGIRFTETLPVRWELAAGKTEQGQAQSYGVDSATGSFMDEVAHHLLDQRLEEEFTTHPYPQTKPTDQSLYDCLASKSWAEYLLEGAHQTNLFVFRLRGDGGYASYYGYDTEGARVCILTDFFQLQRQELTLWPAAYPPIPEGFDPDFFHWLSHMDPLLQFGGQWATQGPLSPDDLQFLAARSASVLPEPFQLYYAYTAPHLAPPDQFQEWWMHLSTKMQRELNTTQRMLPVGRDAVALFEADGTYIIYEWDDAYGVLDYPCSLKTYLLVKVIRDLGTLKADL